MKGYILVFSLAFLQIDKEIENCRFLSIQVDETTDVSTKEVSETFDVSSDRSHFSLVIGL